jgi:hypothetical protein
MSALLYVFEHAGHAVCNRLRAGDQNVGVVARWPNISLGHRSDGSTELFDYRFRSSAALADVAFLAAKERNTVGDIHINPRAQKLAQLWPVQGEESFEDYEFFGLQDAGADGATVSGKIVYGNFDSFALTEFMNMGDEQVVFERSWVVEVAAGAFLWGKMRQVSVIAVECQNGSV